ncbi:MAG: DEAD/DEAH box helicase family protein [Haloarculaceae archaeon]
MDGPEVVWSSGGYLLEVTDDEVPDDASDGPAVDLDEFYDVLESVGRPVVTASEAARALGRAQSQAAVSDALAALARSGAVEQVDVESDPVVWYPTDWREATRRQHVVVFPKRREVVVDQPDQFTRAQLSQFASFVTTNGEEGYVYEVREEDVWNAPYENVDELLGTVRQVLGRHPALEEFVESQWERARKFRLYTHEDGYVVLAARSADLMGNVARQKLPDGVLRAPLSDTESWVAAEKTAEVKRALYEAGYPVQDDRDLETGEPLDVTLDVALRDYQQTWVDRFLDAQSGVLVGPPGSGKTVAALGVLAAVGGETLILVPSRELAAQWRDQVLQYTSLDPGQVGEYHGGEKTVAPVTIATYHTAGMARHRALFDERHWGLVVYDEAQHVPTEVFRRSADLQSRHRLGLSASPVREDEKEEEIFTLIGPPIGTDWAALFDAGYVMEPEVEIRYVPWAEAARDEYAGASGHEKRQLAATNPAKVDAVRRLLAEHHDQKALVFVEYLDQGADLAAALDAPFVSGEMRHAERERLLADFREGQLDTLIVSRVGDEGIDLPEAGLAIVASGLGGSRRQGTQRAGRTMRPAGNALVYVLATRGTREEDFARQQLRHLAGKGVRITEREAETD